MRTRTTRIRARRGPRIRPIGSPLSHAQAILIDRHRLGDAGIRFGTATGDLGITGVSGAGFSLNCGGRQHLAFWAGPVSTALVLSFRQRRPIGRLVFDEDR